MMAVSAITQMKFSYKKLVIASVIVAVIMFSATTSFLGTPFPFSNGASSNDSITVVATNLANTGNLGMFVALLSSSGSLLQSGFAPHTFTGLANNTKYYVQVDDYQNTVFCYWKNGLALANATSAQRAITPESSSVTLVARFSTNGVKGCAGASADSAGVIVPLYMAPGIYWQQVINEKNAYPDVPVLAVIDPNSGVGTYQPSYVPWVKDFQAAGIVVLGYDPTSYGVTPPSTVESNMSDYKAWYNVNGIMFDNMNSTGATAQYYKTLESYAQSEGFTMTVGNPGTKVQSSNLYGIFNAIIIYENGPMPSTTNVNSGFSRYEQIYVANSVSSLPGSSILNSLNPYVSYIYIASSPSYQALPSYFNQEMSYLGTT